MIPRNDPKKVAENKNSFKDLTRAEISKLTLAELNEYNRSIQESQKQVSASIESIAEELFNKLAAFKKSASNPSSFFKNSNSSNSSDTDEDETSKPTLNK